MKWGAWVSLMAVGCGVVVAAVAVLYARRGEPRYGGKKLSEWLVIGSRAHYGSAEEGAARSAVLRIGTNALPFLLRAIQYEPSMASTGLTGVVVGSVKSGAMPGEVGIPLVRALAVGQRDAFCAKYGFRVLGPLASPAVPELAKLMAHTNREVCSRAVDALVLVGRDGVAPLVAALGDERRPNRDLAAWGVREVCTHRESRTNGLSAVPVLLRCLEDGDDRVVRGAAGALGSLAVEPDRCVPALAGLLQQTNSAVRSVGVFALFCFGKEARPAVPGLVGCLGDSDPLIRRVATNALRKIAPEVLGRVDGR
jgi:hypothetical protein